MAEREGTDRETNASTDIIDDALRLVDTLQRKLIVAGVRRGVSGTTSAPAKGDVWEEAVKEEPRQEDPPLDQLVQIARTAAPEVAGHLGRAGSTLLGALGESWQVVERSLRQAEQQRSSSTDTSSDTSELTDGR
ncbi:hypothetical protein RIF23_00155 [Lipingzhangella sp. LS1_29]|uniref:Uncharacterized protein n=1 Tax=Lipingzhangella rawalii TaxID=2055835 RepID=A0ABU2H1K9_9ACTN|nr:hypothetical protein [Lipingzhangella rawalii]MDS1268700.1 hypothetical protein [Lipingzhangella rawalii]